MHGLKTNKLTDDGYGVVLYLFEIFHQHLLLYVDLLLEYIH